MANAFGIIAAILLAVGGFFMLKNKSAIESQQGDLEREQRDLEKNEKVFDTLKTEIASAEEETEQATAENAELVSQIEEKQRSIKRIESEFADQKDVRDQKKSRVDEGTEMLAQFGNLDDLKRRLQKLQIDLATLNGELVAKKAVIESSTARKNVLEGENNELSAVLKKYSEKKSNPELKARISRVVSELGFVILSSGDNAGVIRDSMLEVVRGGEVIGKLQVTGTETGTSAANIIPDTFGEGVRVRVGDTVVAAN